MYIKGAYTIAGISAYCVGNLNIPFNPMPWETEHALALSGIYLYIHICVDTNIYILTIFVCLCCVSTGNGTTTVPHASNLATPLEIQIEASNGASDYGKNVCTYMHIRVHGKYLSIHVYSNSLNIYIPR